MRHAVKPQRKWRSWPALMLVCAWLPVAVVLADDDGDDDDERSASLIIREGRPAIVLEDAQVALAIETAPLRQVTYRPVALTGARVVDLQPLLDARRRHDSVRGGIEVNRIAAATVAERLGGLEAISDGAGLVSTREVNALRAEFRTLEAEHRALLAQQRNIREAALHDWGPALVEEAFAADSAIFRQLVNREAALVEVLIPGDAAAGAQPVAAFNAEPRRAGAWTGRYVSAAARRSLGTRGQTAWYLVEGHELSATTRLYAWLSRGGETSGGQGARPALVPVVPPGALVWHSGRSWVYRQEADGAFVRIAVEAGEATEDGRLVSGAIKAGDLIVTRGAQVLLSEEFRWSIPDEDED